MSQLEIAQTVEAWATVAGIIGAGIWAFLHFQRRRERYPRVVVTHSTHHVRLPDGRVVLRVFATITNSGDVLMRLTEARTWVQQFFPVPEEIQKLAASTTDPIGKDRSEFDWPLLGEMDWKVQPGLGDIEPGESQQLCSDYFLPAEVEQVLIYTHVTNPAKRETGIGWSDSVVVSVQ